MKSLSVSAGIFVTTFCPQIIAELSFLFSNYSTEGHGMLALATFRAVVNLCGRLVTVLLYVLAPTLERIEQSNIKLCGSCFIFTIWASNSEKLQRPQCNFLKLKWEFWNPERKSTKLTFSGSWITQGLPIPSDPSLPVLIS